MSIRRRRKKLSTVISNLDRGLRATTLRRVRRQVATGADAIEEEETTTTTEPPVGTIVSSNTPDQWAKIIGGYYYPPSRTGALGQVELFINQDLTLAVDDRLYVSGTEVSWNQNKDGKTYTGSFRPNVGGYDEDAKIRVVMQYGSPAWSGRDSSTKPVYKPVPAGATNSILYTVENKAEIPNIVTLSFKKQVASYYASTTTATITFTSAHHFVVGHILDVSELPAIADIDGIVQVSSVPSSTQISYTLKKPLDAAIPTTTPGSTSFVYGVVSKYTTVGSSWIDSSSGISKTYIWDGLRWLGYTEALEEGLVTDDGVPPGAPTGLSLSSLGYAETGALGKVSKSSVALSWSAPTTNSTGGSLNDLAGYRIWYSTVSSSGPWFNQATFGLQTSQTILGLAPEVMHYFQVIAYDSYGMDSAGLAGEILTVKTAISVETPSAPTLTTRLGTVTVSWDGKDNTDTITPVDILAWVEVHVSATSGFTPDATTKVGEIYGGAGSYVVTELAYNTDYYFKLVAVDINNRATTASVQSTIKFLPLVDPDLIAALVNNPLSYWPYAPGTVSAGALASGAINASTVFGPGVVTQAAIAANAIGADQIAANAITAGKIVSGAITTAKLDALAVTADKIAANTITADKMSTGYLYAGAINASQITAGTMSGNRITGGVITGTTLQTASTGKRVVINESSNNAINVYNTAGNLVVSISGQTYGSTPSTLFNGPVEITGPLWLTASGYAVDEDGNAGGDGVFYITGGSMSVSGGIYSDSSIEGTGVRGTRYVQGGEYRSSGGLVIIRTAGRISPVTDTLSSGNWLRQVSSNGEVTLGASSSRRYKNSEASIWTDPDLDPHKLLSIPVKVFKYNDGYLRADDEKCGVLMPGLIAEDVAEHYPIAVFKNEDGLVENWEDRHVLAGALALIQELTSRVESLENK